MSETETPKEAFSKTVYCHQCKRDYLVRSCQSRCNTLLTEIQLVCPRCRRKLKKLRMKDWYDHYVHEKPEESRRV